MRRVNGGMLLFFVLSAFMVQAQHHEPSAGKTSGAVDLGEINFPTSGPADAQKHFIEGVLLLHSFEYERSRRAFAEAARVAPSFALAYWGEAMTYDHPIWAENDKPGALAVLARLGLTRADRREKAATPREKMYLDAIERLYGEGDATSRARAYMEAMAELAARFPEDLEARAFYSLSLLGLTRTTRNTENYMLAAGVAEAIYEKNPRHPGALHYLIHAYDDPAHAPRGLRAAHIYGTVARSASHAQHMPSHIFFALGMWQDSVTANTASMKTARDEGTGGYHAMHWLEHGYLQLGRVEDAVKLLTIIEDDAKRTSSSYNRTHLAMCRATMLVETRGGGPASIMEPVDAAGISATGAFSNHDMAMGLEFVRRKDLTEARRMLARMRERSQAGKGAPSVSTGAVDRYSAVTKDDIDTATVMENILEAAIQFAGGDRKNAIKKIVAAGEAEDKLVFEYGPPAIVKPAWEAAGEMLLQAGRKKEAANAFRNVLKRYPNRRLANEGLRNATGA